MTLTNRGLAVIATILALSVTVRSQEVDDPFAATPGSARAAFYERNASEIKLLQNQVTFGDTESRLEALNKLAIGYMDAALSLATTLVGDQDEAVARKAARLLAASIVMHNLHPSARERRPVDRQIMKRVEAARAALHEALDDPRDSVRRVASGSLASLSDERALARIDAASKAGVLTTVEAINYFGLADPTVGTSFIEPHLDGDSPRAQQSAAIYLGANPRYHARIRDNMFFDPDADMDTRIVATQVLGRYDPEFGSYALIVAFSQSISVELFKEIIEKIIDNWQADTSLNSSKSRALLETIKHFEDVYPDADFQKIYQRLDRH